MHLFYVLFLGTASVILVLGFTCFDYFQFNEFGTLGSFLHILAMYSELFIFLLVSGCCMFLDIFIFPMQAIIWLMGFILFVFGFMFALLQSHTDTKIYHSLWGIPSFIFYQVLSLLKVRKANEISIATQHFHDSDINEIK